MANALELHQLTKKYATGVEALKGIDLTVHKGDFLGLLGPNGAGKSTLIHCIMGLSIPTSGSANVFGHDVVKDYQQSRMLCGFAPQDINLDWFLTAYETLDFHGGYYGMKKKQRGRRIEELMKAFSIWDQRDTNTRQLSGGMKRRLVLARAMMHRPKVLILDEPTAGVDVELRHELHEYVRQINERGTTIILTTHYIEEAEQLCNRIALIDHGQLVNQGTADELKEMFNKDTLEDVYLAVTEEKDRRELAKA
jgi:ABC-2 type transport system ATP-binding protein